MSASIPKNTAGDITIDGVMTVSDKQPVTLMGSELKNIVRMARQSGYHGASPQAVVIFRRPQVDMTLGQQEVQIIELKDHTDHPGLLRHIKSEAWQQAPSLWDICQVIWLDEGVVNENYEG